MLFCASVFLLYWVFRPGTKEKYSKFSEIPLKREMKDVSNPKSEKGDKSERSKE
jgi:hypothetical protein